MPERTGDAVAYQLANFSVFIPGMGSTALALTAAFVASEPEMQRPFGFCCPARLQVSLDTMLHQRKRACHVRCAVLLAFAGPGCMRCCSLRSLRLPGCMERLLRL